MFAWFSSLVHLEHSYLNTHIFIDSQNVAFDVYFYRTVLFYATCDQHWRQVCVLLAIHSINNIDGRWKCGQNVALEPHLNNEIENSLKCSIEWQSVFVAQTLSRARLYLLLFPYGWQMMLPTGCETQENSLEEPEGHGP